MADQVGRAALTIGGAFFFGAPGALIGGLLGDILFPQKAGSGPRINELNVQHSTVGSPIPLVYGTAALAGNVIWSGGLVETKHAGQSGGKGGPSGPSSYTYSVDVAIGICEGPIDGVRRIWADADLIYDASDDATLTERLQGTTDEIPAAIAAIRAMSAQLDFTLYLGSEDQLPDPTIEAAEGVGEVPGYRGLAYAVLPAFQLEKYGNRIPVFRWEVYTGAPTVCGLYSAGNLEPWQYALDSGTRDPRNPLNTHTYGYTIPGGIANGTLDDALADAAADLGRPIILGAVPQASGNYVHGWGNTPTSNDLAPCDPATALLDYVQVQMLANSLHNTSYVCIDAPSPNYIALCTLVGSGGSGGTRHFAFGGSAAGFYAHLENAFDPTEPFFEGITGDYNCSGHAGELLDTRIGVRRSLLPPDPCLYGTALAGAPGYCTIAGQIVQAITWTPVSGSFHALQAYHETSGIVDAYPVDPCLPSTDPNYNDSAYWTAAYAADQASASPELAAGLTYGVDYPQFQNFAYFSECDTVDTACVPMATIVADLCRRAGLRTDTGSQIDVTDLTTCVFGYIVGTQMSARDALGPLRLYGLWDCVESGAELKFIERGHAIGATLTVDDLGVHEAGSEPPSAVTVTRVQEKDLPRRVRLHFPNFLHDHEASEEDASRITTEAINELDVEIPVSMDPDTAAQLAEITLYAEWIGRNTFTFSLDNDWLKLEPTDCIELPVDGETRRARVVDVQYSIGGILEVTALADDDGSYVSTAVARPGTPSGGPIGAPGTGPICGSVAVLLDLPRLRAIDVDAGYYAAIYGLCDSWTCAELYRSNDGGLTYGRVARTDRETTVGEINAITGPATDPTLPGESPPYDTANAITVTLFEGELASVTDAQIAAGQNTAAIGVDGRWVIVQFKTATLDTTDQYTLTDLIWGVNETQHLLGTTVAGDTFVLLSDADLLRIPESPEAIGVSKEFKVVTCGEALDDVTPFSFTTWGLSYLRLCPSQVISATVSDPPVSPADGDAYLLPTDTSLTDVWATHGGEIAKWSDETDSWVYCTPVPGTIITIGGDSSGAGGEDVISGGDGTYTDAPWTPAIPPLDVIDSSGDIATSYFVVWTGTEYVKVLGSDMGGGGAQAALQFKDEGSNLGTAGTADTVDFVGAGVVATRVGNTITATIAGTGSQAGIQFKDEGSNLGSSGTVDTVDVVGSTIAATRVSNTVTLTSTAVAGPGSSTDEAIARFDGTTGKLLQNSATLLSDADLLTTPNADASEVGFKGIPQNSQTTNYTLVLADAGKCIYKGSGGAITITIPANSGGGGVAFPVGTCVEGINDDTETLTIAITTDTLVLAPTGATGSRLVAARGWWTIRKVASTKWYISGAGVT